MSNATFLVITHQLTHPSWTAQGRRALPYECAHHPPRCPIRATAITDVKCNSAAIINVKCSCAGSSHINRHISWSAQGRRALPYECAHHPPFCPIRANAITGQMQRCWFITHQLTHTPWTAQGRRALSYKFAHHPPCCPIGAITGGECNCTGSPHTFPMVSPRTPCTPLRVCAPSPASQCGPAPSLMSSATKDIFNKLKIFWSTVSGEPLAVKHALSKTRHKIFKQARNVFNMVNSK